jgi:hypothetical protein
LALQALIIRGYIDVAKARTCKRNDAYTCIRFCRPSVALKLK